MKKLFTFLFTVAFIGLQAQIFINTNPKKPIESTPVETTPTNQVPVVTTPSVSTPSITTPSITTPSITSPSMGSGTITRPGTSTIGSGFSGATTTTTTTSSGTNVINQNSGAALEDVPPNAEPGKCYARCLIADKYGFVTETVIDQPKSVKKIKLPALYTTVYDTVVIRPKSSRIIRVPAEYETVREQVMVSPSTTKWVKGKADAGCLSANPADCQVMCLVEVPATYKTVTRQILKNEAYERTVSVPMDFKIVAKQVKVKNESYADIPIEATYKTVQKRVLTEKGGYQVWREILCANQLTTSKISQIQMALKAKGYNPGPIDNVFGAQTKEALVKYQRDKGLPIGNLNLETLTSLGL